MVTAGKLAADSRLKIDVTGSGDVKLNVDAPEVVSEATGSGSAQVYASKQLDVRISGSGDVAYKGTPQINQHIAGSGSVRSAP